jgi:hypothetical protein
MRFAQAIERQLAGEIVRVSRFAEFRFRSETLYLWPGQFPFVDVNGRRWMPTQGIGQVTGIAQALNGSAPELRFELSGVDREFIARAQGAASEYYGRLAIIHYQFFGEAGEPLDEPQVFTWGLMRSLIFTRQAVEGGTMAVVTLTAESPFDGRARARNSYLTDRDQKTRNPGDQICERIAGIESKSINWPAF